MQIKIHRTYRDVVAVCDSELLGKYFEEGKFQLDVKESFYKGEEKTEREVIEILADMAREDATFNFAGKKAVECALQVGIITPHEIGKIQGVPFALVLM